MRGLNSFSPKAVATLAAAVSLVILLPDILQPLNGDVDIYHTMGYQLATFHQLPYIGSWDQNFPGIAYFHAAVVGLFGISPIAFRIVFVLLQLLQAMTLFWICHRVVGDRFAFFVAVLDAALYMFGTVWMSGQRDCIAVTFILLATALLYRQKDKERSALGTGSLLILCAGALFGAAITLRPTYAFYPGVVCLLFVWEYRADGLKRIALLAAGALTVIILAVLPYAFIEGGFRELYLATIKFNVDIYATSKYAVSLTTLSHNRGEVISDAIVLLSTFVLLLKRRANWQPTFTRHDALLFAGYYVGARLTIIVMGKFFMQHYAMTFALSAVLAALVVEFICVKLSATADLAIATVLSMALILVIYSHSFVPNFARAVVQGSAEPLETAYREDKGLPAHEWIAIGKVTDYLRSKGVAGTRLECWGLSPSVYWRTKAISASRFTMMHPLTLERPQGGHTDYQERWRKEFIDSLVAVKPMYIVSADSSINYHTAAYYRHQFIPFDSLISADYVTDTIFPTFSIYRRKL